MKIVMFCVNRKPAAKPQEGQPKLDINFPQIVV